MTVNRSYYHIRHLNDELCSEHQLSVISPTNQRGKSYKEWTSGRNGTSWKIKLKQDIDEAIQNADTYEQCMELVRAKGYEIKGESIGKNTLKYISFRPLDREHFVRGSIKSLGAEYTKERIKERVETKALAQTQKRVPFLPERNLLSRIILPERSLTPRKKSSRKAPVCSIGQRLKISKSLPAVTVKQVLSSSLKNRLKVSLFLQKPHGTVLWKQNVS